jgi:hypothetical protein
VESRRRDPQPEGALDTILSAGVWCFALVLVIALAV